MADRMGDRTGAAGSDRDLGRPDGSQTPGGMPAPRTDPADTGLGDGTDDPTFRTSGGGASGGGGAAAGRRPTGDETVGDPTAASREGGLEAGAGTGGLGLGDTRSEARGEGADAPADRGRYDPDVDEGNEGLFGGRAGGTGI
jgi:hypothetical protein